ncbi:MAG: CBS domain-containing protein [Candidatus Woesearchaeota archaeon]|nr:CBS domain-containing protein [Candidatus Woesearchaeota archaeon]
MGLFGNFIKKRQHAALKKQIEQLRQTTVAEIMTTFVVTGRPDDTIIQTATKMIAEDISCLIVMDGEKLAGILSERDFLNKVPLDKKVFNMKVKQIMTPNVVTMPPETSLPEAVTLMKKRNFRRMVIADGEQVVGIMTQTDVSRKIAEIFTMYPAIPIDDIMTSKVLTTSPKESFPKARGKMQKINVGSIIIEEKGEIRGIFTEYDVVMQFYDQQGKLHIKDVSEFMRKSVKVTEKGMDIFVANRLLLEKKMHRLPITQEGKLIGIVTQTDVIRFICCELDKILACEELKKFPSKLKFKSEFKGEHAKVYTFG